MVLCVYCAAKSANKLVYLLYCTYLLTNTTDKLSNRRTTVVEMNRTPMSTLSTVMAHYTPDQRCVRPNGMQTDPDLSAV